MQTQCLPLSSHTSLQTLKNPIFTCQSSIFSNKPSLSFLPPNFQNSLLHPNSCMIKQRSKLATCCSNHTQEPISNNDGRSNPSVSNFKEEERKMEGLEKQSIWKQMKEIVMFTGPATGLWLCGPLMSLVDTAVIGQGSSLELAALGPGTVICDYTSYVFMFLSIATSNLVATSLARKMHKVLISYIIALSVGPRTHSLEGALPAGRDLKFISLSTCGCLSLGAILLILARNGGYGLPGCWCALLGFQWARFFLSLQRLLSPDGVLYSEDLSRMT